MHSGLQRQRKISGIIRKLAILGCAAATLLLLGSCAKTVNDPDLLIAAREAVYSERVSMPLWQDGVSGADAVITPENFTLHGETLSLNAIYRLAPADDGSDSAKFALFLPQGLKLGQCLRTGDRYRCSNLPLPGTEELLRAAFMSIDAMYRLKPDGSDRFELIAEGNETRIKRVRRQRESEYSLSYGLGGKLIAAEKKTAPAGDEDERRQASAGWKADFNDDPAGYHFRQAGSGLAFGVSITGVRKEK